MEWLNYHHLHYFWVVAREGSVTAAAKRLRVSHPTVSAQIGQLEDVLGVELFEKRGRGLVLTDAGRDVLSYADAIFALGKELVQTAKGRPRAGALRLRVGVVDRIPKSVAHRLLTPALTLGRSVRLVVREDLTLDGFLAELAAHELDLVLSDRPAGSSLAVRVYSHALGSSGTVALAAPAVASRLEGPFPECLDGAPLIVPSLASGLRRGIDSWLETRDLRPEIVAEIDDSALVKAFAEAGVGVCVVPRVVEAEVVKRHALVRLGEIPVTQRYYALSAERRLAHPAVVAVRDAARAELDA